ncbi:hypothetical protein NPIL_328981 [Nephila pilipes]|uniref:Uncharacterized protein n=1 Tax=Nephila pilipes TaxID=299642 RepID=A0A8X6QAN3_NEPPI|nr:hypothetical protein NPIL_328981 [Nephila pilipes]
MFKIILFLALWAITQAGFPQPSMPGNPDDLEGWDFDKIVYPCFTSMLCIHKNETHNKLAECMPAVLDGKKLQKAMDFINPEGADTSQFNSLYELHEAFYCSIGVEERKALFDYMVKEIREYMAGGCLRTDEPDFCASWEDTIACFIELCEKMDLEGMCDVEEFDSS